MTISDNQKKTMKLIFTLAVLAALGACQDDPEIRYAVAPELEGYVQIFYSEAAERGEMLPRNLVAELNPNIQSVVRTNVNRGQYYLYVSPTIFNEMKSKGMENEIEAMVSHGMAELFVKKASVAMTEYATYHREGFFDSIFQ